MRAKMFFKQFFNRIKQYLIMLPWLVIGFIMRLLYGFRVVGEERIPNEGPYIVLQSEFGLVCFLVTGWSSIMLSKDIFFNSPDKIISYTHEQLFTFAYFRGASDQAKFMRPLIPHSAGRMALGLMDGYKALRKGGLVMMNPEGDMGWDGRPLPIGPAAAWLALHTAAPIVPILPSASTYDIWPRWKMTPSLRGRIELRVGKPFKLCETPQKHVTDQDLESANTRIREAFDELRYGSEGLTGWVGEPQQGGVPLNEPVNLRPRPELVITKKTEHQNHNPVWKRGIAQVLWQCPVCATEDALIHANSWFGPSIVHCQACETKWAVKRLIGNDFRLEIVEGPPDLLGLDMALSTWYDEMKKGFQPSLTQVSSVDLWPDENVYLKASDVPFSVIRPNALLDGWNEREPPLVQPPARPDPGDWPNIGVGQLLLTNNRLLWQGPDRELDFKWSSVTAVYMWLLNTLGIRYGSAHYRFSLGQEVGLKWLTYAGTIAMQTAEQHGHKVTVSPF